MIYCITGGTGLVGRAVKQALIDQGHTVRILSRNPRQEGEYSWDPSQQTMDSAALDGAHGIVHLAGASVSSRWTANHKRAIMNSRIQGAQTLYRGIEAMATRPEVFVGASAVGIYPSSFDRVYTELDGGAKGFLGDVVREWEAQSDRFESLGIRVAKIRIGIVLGRNNGILKMLLPIFRLGLGSALGNGKQWLPWIHVEDLAAMIARLATDPNLRGTWNGTGPDSATNLDFSRTLAEAVKRPFWMPAVPLWTLKLVLGEMAQIAIMSTNCSAVKWNTIGFKYRFSNLSTALKDLVQ
jgi:uncharacterized protein (TIGR01777 family)